MQPAQVKLGAESDSAQKFFSISEAAQQLGVSAETLRRWERSGKIKVGRTPTGNRIFSSEDISKLKGAFLSGFASHNESTSFQNNPTQPYTTLHIAKNKFKLSPRLSILTALLIIAVVSNFYLLSLTPLPHEAILGVKDFIAPVLEESAPLGNLLGKVGNFLRGGSFVVPLLGKSELSVSDDLKVQGNAQIAKDIEGLGDLNIKGTAIVGKLVTGIIDPYLIENDGGVQPLLEIRSVGDISLKPQGNTVIGNLVISNSNVSGISNLTITNNETIGGNLTVEGNIETKKDLKIGKNITLSGVINSNTFTSTKLTFAGSSPAITTGTKETAIALDAGTSGAVNIASSSTGDINLGGGSSSTGCTITNSNGNITCSGDLAVNGGDITTTATTFNFLTSTVTTLNLGGSSSSVVISGRPTFTKAPTSAHTGTFTIDSSTWNQSDASIYINPASATADSNLLGVAVGGNVKFDVDAEGDIYGNNLILTGNTTSATTTVSGTLSVEGNTTLGDATTDTLTINPATITLSGGNKTIDITGAATRTLTILNSTVSQVADLDLSDGSLTTAGTSRLTNAGVLQNITGLTVSSGTVSLPNDQIDPSEITQGTAGQLLLSNATPDTAWTTLSGDATLAGTGALTLANSGVTANTYGSTTAIPVITVDAKGRLTTVTTASISSAWSSLTDPTTNLSLTMAANTTTLTYNAATGASTNLFTLTDTASNTGTGYLLNVATASLSNALPLRIAARGNTIIDTTALGAVTIGNATSAQAVTVDAGTATLNLGNSNSAKTINIGTGTAADTINIGSGGTTADTITIGGLSGTTINITGTVNITGAIVGTSTIQGTRLISTVADGTAPLTVTSTTNVANLNASTLSGNTAATISPVVDVQTFTANGTWTKPTNAKWVRVIAFGGGGGGAGGTDSGAGTNRTSGGAGGGGAYVERLLDSSALGATETITVGAGGTGGASAGVGTGGGNSSFGSHITAYGGGTGNVTGAGGATGGGGGAGGGSTSAGSAGTGTSGNAGGGPAFPGTASGRDRTGSGGAQGGGDGVAGGNAERGGGAGSGGGTGSGTDPGLAGGSSLLGGPGGGAGGGVNASNVATAGGAGGAYGSYAIGGGGAGGAATGAAGTPGTSRSGTGKAGNAGGGGGGSSSGAGGAGGAGGTPGAGGGSGGGGTGTGGAGGAGARGEVIVYSIGKNTLADLAEEYRISDTSIEAGDVVKLVNDPQIHDSTLVGKTNKGYDGEVLGIISTNPSIILGDSYPYLVNLNFSDLDKYKNTNIRPVALSGRVPVKVTSENGAIRRGDILTSSATRPGYAMKATRAGRSIGIAMENFSCEVTSNQSLEPSAPNLQALVTNTCTGKIMIFVNLSWYDPDVYLTNSGELVISNNTNTTNTTNNPIALGDNGLIQTPKYQVTNIVTKEIIERTGAFNDLFVANLKVGSLDVGEFTNDKLKNIELRLKNLELATSSAVLSASISALLTDNNSLLTANASSSAVSSQGLVVEQLSVLGRTVLNDLGITGKITSGLLSINGLASKGETFQSYATIDTLSGDLYLQSQGLGGINILLGKVTIDKDGNLKVLNTIAAQKIEADQFVSSKAAGSSVLPANTANIDVISQNATETARILVTPTTLIDKVLTVTQKSAGKFTVSIKQIEPQDIKFDWFIVN